MAQAASYARPTTAVASATAGREPLRQPPEQHRRAVRDARSPEGRAREARSVPAHDSALFHGATLTIRSLEERARQLEREQEILLHALRSMVRDNTPGHTILGLEHAAESGRCAEDRALAVAAARLLAQIDEELADQ